MPGQPPPFSIDLTLKSGRMPEVWKRFFLDQHMAISGDFAPSNGPFLLTTAGINLPASTNLGALASGYLKILVAAGVAVPSTTATIPASDIAAGTAGINITGNAATATKLLTARAINGVNFDGTAAITVTAAAGTLTGATLAANVLASSLTSVGVLAGLTVTAPIVGSVTGAAGSVAASALTGTTLAAGVTASSLTSVGTLAALTVTAPIAGSVTGTSGSTTGNAATATKLQTARLINGLSFDGSADVTGAFTAGSTGAGFTVALSTATVTGTLADARLSANVPLLPSVLTSFGVSNPGGNNTLAISNSAASGAARFNVLSNLAILSLSAFGSTSGSPNLVAVTSSHGLQLSSAAITLTLFAGGGISNDATNPGANNLRVAGTILSVGDLTCTGTIMSSGTAPRIQYNGVGANNVLNTGSGGASLVVSHWNGAVDITSATFSVSALTMNLPLTLKGYTVGTLPAGVQGHVAFVTDLLAPTYLAGAVGGGAIVGPVFYNGGAWISI